MVLDETGKPDFERLRRRALLKKKTSINYAAQTEPAALFAFDALVIAGKDLRNLPLLKRKDALQSVLQGSQRIRLSSTWAKAGRACTKLLALLDWKVSSLSGRTRPTRPGGQATGSRSARRLGGMRRTSGQRNGISNEGLAA